MICPNCKKDARFYTIDTRHRSWGIKRVKVCPLCKKRVPTIEIYEVSDDALESLDLSNELIKAREAERNLNA